VHQKEITPIELVEAAIERIERLNPAVLVHLIAT
jgi:Asp-tRNA(Asn)/Glu-tRNA(Gln) amidotransferase A subunit family amidase